MSHLPAKSTGLNNYHGCEVSVHGCMMSLWCTSLALLTRSSVFPVSPLRARWLRIQPLRFWILMPRLASSTLWGTVTQWHANGLGRLKLAVSCLLAIALTRRYDRLLTGRDWCASLSSEMIELDGDEERISSQGRYAERDIVQVQTWPSGCEAVRLFTQRNVSREMWGLWLMGKGHGVWPFALLLFSLCHFSVSLLLHPSSEPFPSSSLSFHSVLLLFHSKPGILFNDFFSTPLFGSLFSLLDSSSCPVIPSSFPFLSSVCTFQRLHWPARKPHPQHGPSG